MRGTWWNARSGTRQFFFCVETVAKRPRRADAVTSHTGVTGKRVVVDIRSMSARAILRDLNHLDVNGARDENQVFRQV